MARVALPESKIRARRRRRRIVLSISLVIVLALVAGGGIYLAQASFLRISHIDVIGEKTLATSTVAEYAQDELAGNYLYFFPKNNIFLYPKNDIASTLQGRLPVIKDVQVVAENFTTLRLELTERTPKALWCGEVVASTTSCELLDEDGVAYGPALEAANTYVHYFGALGTSTPRQYTTPGEFHSLTALIDTIAENQSDSSVASVFVDGQSDVHLSFGSGFTLLFPLDADGGDVYERLQLALTSDPFKEHTLSDFDYLDLRFGDKLYYKLKSQ